VNFGKNGQNMNENPVWPARKTENAPTQRPQNGLFGTPDWGLFFRLFRQSFS